MVDYYPNPNRTVLKYCFSLLFCIISLSLYAQSFYEDGVQEIRLELPYTSWDAKLDSLKKNAPKSRLLATATVNGTQYKGAGIRYKGNSSYFRSRKETYKKLPFNLKLNYVEKDQALPTGQTNIKLSNGFLDPSFVRDPLAYGVIRNYMPAPLCNFARLYINDTFWGLYVNTESIDSKFLRKHFGTDEGNLIKCDPDNWKKTRSESGCPKGKNASLVYLSDDPECYAAFYEVDKPEDWPPLIKLIKTLHEKPEAIETVLDVDQTLWMLALNNILINFDSYNGALSHNYYLWFDTTGVGHPLIWDLNLAFGGWRRDLSFKKMNDEALIQYHPLSEINNEERPLISKLLQNEWYRKIYLAHYRTILKEQLLSGALIERAKSLQKQIDPWVQKDNNKLYTYEAFQNSMSSTFTTGSDKVIGLQELMGPRAEWLSSLDILQDNLAPLIAKPNSMVRDSTCVTSVQIDNADAAWMYYRSGSAFAFSKIQMTADSTNTYMIELPAASVRDYYIVAENQEAASTYPERASFAFETIKPKEGSD